MKFIPVKVMSDASHKYLVPNEFAQEFAQEFSDMINKMYEDDFEDQDAIDEFEKKFGQYRTGGSVNNVQLYIKKK